jgi:disulfide bond formation protein DsbB
VVDWTRQPSRELIEDRAIYPALVSTKAYSLGMTTANWVEIAVVVVVIILAIRFFKYRG